MTVAGITRRIRSLTTAALLSGALLGAVAVAQRPGSPLSEGFDLNEHPSFDRELFASFRMNLSATHPGTAGEGWLKFTASFDDGDPAHRQSVTAMIPLFSTEDAYGESCSCKVNAHGVKERIFTGGLDEQNFIRFQPGEPREFEFLLDKYLCRILAAPFTCDGQREPWPDAVRDMKHWRLQSYWLVKRTAQPATMVEGPMHLRKGAPFDYAQCATVAPSNGMCCVQRKETAWQCGVAPTGPGWHQVSGECYHRETGNSCKE